MDEIECDQGRFTIRQRGSGRIFRRCWFQDQTIYSMTVDDGQLLVAGGFDGDSVTSRAEILNKWTNSWEEVGDLPSTRSASAIITASVDVLRPETVEKLRENWKFGKWRNQEIIANNDDDLNLVMDIDL